MEKVEKVGIQAFDTPEEAFHFLSSSYYGINGVNIVILNDRQFVRVIRERIVTIMVDAILGNVSKKKCKDCLGLEDKINDYLLDWNYFLYSSRNNRYYTSFMEYKGNFCYLWSEREWNIFEDLYHTYHFDMLIEQGIDFVEEHYNLIDNYGNDAMEYILEELWNYY